MAQKLFFSFFSTKPLRSPLPIRLFFSSPFTSTSTAKKRNPTTIHLAKKTTPLSSSSSTDKTVLPLEELLRRRTRSEREFDEDFLKRFGDAKTHIPVLLGEVLDVFSSYPIRSFVDCTLGAAGHSSAIIQTHPELEVLVGLDVDPIAHGKSKKRINRLLDANHENQFKAHVLLKNFRDVKQAICEVDAELLVSGVDGILMDLGMSSMQVDDSQRGLSVLNDGPLDMRMDPQGTLKAEDILNSWPATDIGRILRDYGEESHWFHLQHKIVQARQQGGLHSTKELVSLIRSGSRKQEGRHGWIKTSSRVFQALRIAVNDELEILKGSLHACFDCLRPGGRLAVISFHSLEDRIVKQTFLDIINSRSEESGAERGKTVVIESEEFHKIEPKMTQPIYFENDAWIKQTVKGSNGVILTKRPVTASADEERLNSRCRSAKLRVIQRT